MHESVVTLHTLIADERETIRAATETLHAGTHDAALLNHAYVEEQIRMRTKRCDDLDELIRDYLRAPAGGADAALKLVLIQYAAATMVEAKRGERPDGPP